MVLVCQPNEPIVATVLKIPFHPIVVKLFFYMFWVYLCIYGTRGEFLKKKFFRFFGGTYPIIEVLILGT